jgi:tRNA(fMet)-specific endonuclease VapC
MVAEPRHAFKGSVALSHFRKEINVLIKVKSFDVSAARSYGSVRKATRKRKSDHLDKLIAAHAIALEATLVTNNERDFAAYPPLTVRNWMKH